MHALRSLLVLLATGGLLQAADWPQWLGPRRDGSSPEKVAPWKKPPQLVWKQTVGVGHSSPIVANGKVFLHAKVKDKDEEEVSAYDAESGKILWSKSYARGTFTSEFGVGPRATPAVDGDRLYTFGVTGILTCWDTANGTQHWQIDTLKEFKAKNLFFGASCSPLIEGNLVLVNVGGKGASVVAFDKMNGKVAWKTGDDPASYSSPIALGKGKERQIIFLTQQGLVSLDPSEGNVFWKIPMVDRLNESSTTPVVLGEMLLASSVTFGSIGVHLETKEGKPAAEQKWKQGALTCYFSTPVTVGSEHVYMVTGAVFPPSATLRCVEMKTGKELWQKAKVGKYHAALLRTGDDHLLMLEDSGSLVLFAPSPKGYMEKARSQVCGPTWAHPALSQGRIYLRDDRNNLMCLQPGE